MALEVEGHAAGEVLLEGLLVAGFHLTGHQEL